MARYRKIDTRMWADAKFRALSSSDSVSSRAGQRSRILGVLIAAHGTWVPLPEIIECAAQYNARIFELRRLGFRIANRTREVDGRRCSWFRLESRPATATTRDSRDSIHRESANSFPEFGSLGPEHYGVD